MIQYKILGIIAVLVACFVSGYKVNDLKWSNKVVAAENEAYRLNEELRKSRAGANYLLQQSINDILDEQEQETKVIYREKIVYRDSPDAGTCVFPADGLQILNSAAGMPRDSESAREANEEAAAKIADIQVVD